MRLDDPEVVRQEYATDERLRERRLDVWADVSDGDPEEVALTILREGRPGRVLDAGCGAGLFASQIEASEVIALDVSPFMVERARELGLDARLGDIQALPFPDRTFGAAVCNWALYHLPDLDRGLAELARVIRPRGRLVAVTNSELHLGELWRVVQRAHERVTFTAENGTEALLRHFKSVERLDVEGTVTWPSRDALEGYLNAQRLFLGDVVIPEIPFPFGATRRNCVFVAER